MKSVGEVYPNFSMSEKCQISHKKRQDAPPQMLPSYVGACLLTILKFLIWLHAVEKTFKKILNIAICE